MSNPQQEDFLPPPPEFDKAPEWARAIWVQQRRDQHRTAGELMLLHGDLRAVKATLGQKPDSDGQNGKGLLGDVNSLMLLRSKGIGFIAAIGVTGAVLLLGLAKWVEAIVAGAK